MNNQQILYQQRKLVSTPSSENTENIVAFFPLELLFLNLIFNPNYFLSIEWLHSQLKDAVKLGFDYVTSSAFLDLLVFRHFLPSNQ